MNKDKFIFELSKLRSDKHFLRIEGLRTDYGPEVFANVTFNMPYKKAIEESLHALKGYFPSNLHHAMAKNELVGKFKAALISMSEQKTIEDESGFLPLLNDDRKRIEGVRFHKPSSTLHVFSFVSNKELSLHGNAYAKGFPRYNPIIETFKKICPALRFERMAISPWNVENIRVENILLLEGGNS